MIDQAGCDACGFETKELKEYQQNRGFPKEKKPPKVLCDLCANTLSGTALEYPESYPQRETIYTICYVGNVILKALKEKK